MKSTDDDPRIKLICSICGKSFSTKSNLTKHSKNVHDLTNNRDNESPENKLECTLCSGTFSKKANLNRHMSEQHLEVNQIICPGCREYFTRYESLFRHIDTRHVSESGECPMCDAIFPDLKALYKHTQTNHKLVNDQHKFTNHQCEVCKKSFAFKQSLTRHMQNFHEVVHKSNPRTVKCPLCTFTSYTVTALDNHLVKHHSIQLNAGKKNFDSIDDFKKWKEDIEHEDLAYFTKKRTVENRTYYECHRSGSTRETGASKKIRWRRRTKICKTCPARMVVNDVDGQIHVYYQRKHVGHFQTKKRSNTAAFKEQRAQFLETAPEKSIHVGDSGTPHACLAALLNATLSASSRATEEAVENAISRVQSIYEFLQQNQLDPSVPSIANFPKLSTNLPSQKKIEKQQRFFSMKNKGKPTDHKVAKPTVSEKSSIKTAVNDLEFSKVLVRSIFDHDYEANL